MQLIKDALNYAKEIFKNDYSGLNYFHTLRVFNLVKEIAKNQEKARKFFKMLIV